MNVDMNEDMFSLLPVEIITKIASFLPFKEAAKSSILSKRWLKIWKSRRDIEFNEFFFVKSDVSDEIKEAHRRIFLNFITHSIQNYEEKVVNKFSLKVSNPQSCADTVQDCIAFATKHLVKELRLDFSDPTWEENDFDDHDALFQLPCHVYMHKTLEALELNACSFVVHDLVNFRALKDVSLGWIEVKNSTIRTLLSICRNLESLSLNKCWNLAHFDMGGHELGLRRLVIDNCHFVDYDYVYFRAPNLKFLKYSGTLEIFQIEVGFSMQEAELDFTPMPDFEEYGDILCQLLCDLNCVYVLTVCSFLLQAIPTGEEPVRIQCNMNVRHLIIKTKMHNQELRGFMFMLNSCACLKKLTIEIGQGKIYEDYPYSIDSKKFWGQQCIIFECLRRNLKVVELKGFRGTTNEMGACRYLIQAGRVLEQIIINVVKKEGDEFLEKRYANATSLLNVRKASKNLRISIV
uniref:F-box/LRR-repeat protein At1g56400 family n=2 Tax=Cajanus cajan TaxID=3821 RepID=A0A151T0S8_CAJCA|nr:Putative F-box/LRR-repeat protein At1g56400 family [Cajanus cajan]